jgi:uncharacterized protein YjbI with pentapeptide repeats
LIIEPFVFSTNIYYIIFQFRLPKTSFSHISLRHGNITHCSLRHRSLRNASLRHRSFRHRSLRYGSLRHRNLRHDSLRYRSLRHDSLRHRSLRHRSLRHDSLRHDSLRHRSLRHRSLRHDSLRHRSLLTHGSFGANVTNKNIMSKKNKMATSTLKDFNNSPLPICLSLSTEYIPVNYSTLFSVGSENVYVLENVEY